MADIKDNKTDAKKMTDMVFAQIDKNKSGDINFEELLSYFNWDQDHDEGERILLHWTAW